mmetsp:Transcript_30411/g.85126  ORF Transcript_30411/g.85126 Transcript_30411/m.85126 type:complete len:288 (+) Transcript_30411:804-1667(+)
MHSAAWAAMTATESLGVTKKRLPRIMLRSASPSAAAPKQGAPSPNILATSSLAYVRLGSGWPPPKSGRGSQFMSAAAGSAPSSSQKTRRAEAPATPCIPSNTMEKSGRASSARMAPKSKTRFSRARCVSAPSNTSTENPPPRSWSPGRERSTCSSGCMVLYSAISVVRRWMARVRLSGAGPPFSQLYLTPKSPSGPPGLCEAVRMKAPKALSPRGPTRSRMVADTAGVAISVRAPTHTRLTPLAAAMETMVRAASGDQCRPSPLTTSAAPGGGAGRLSNVLCTKFSR